MQKSPRTVFAFLAIALLSPTLAVARPLTEDAALKLLLGKLEHDHAFAKRISLDCVTFETEETTRTYFEFAVREKHNAKCGGDPETSPVIDRYRVNRASGKIEWNDAVNETWLPYDPAKVR